MAGCAKDVSFFFFNDTATTEIYTLSLHDALPIWIAPRTARTWPCGNDRVMRKVCWAETKCSPCKERRMDRFERSEEHTSELQSRQYLVCRLLLEKKKITSW